MTNNTPRPAAALVLAAALVVALAGACAGQPPDMSASEKAFYQAELSSAARLRNQLLSSNQNAARFGKASGVVRETYRAEFDEGGRVGTVALVWPHAADRTKIQATLSLPGDRAADAARATAYVPGDSTRVVVTTVGGGKRNFMFASERLVLRLDAGHFAFFMLRQNGLASREGVTPKAAVNALLLAAREVLDSYDTSRLVHLSGGPGQGRAAVVPLVKWKDAEQIKAAFWPAVNSLMTDMTEVAAALPKAAGGGPSEESQTIVRMAVAVGETFQRMAKWTREAGQAWKQDTASAEGALRRLLADGPLVDKATIARTIREVEAYTKAHPQGTSGGTNEETFSLDVGQRVGLSDELSRHLVDTHQDRKHRAMALEAAEEQKIREAFATGTDPMWNRLNSEFDRVEQELRAKYHGDSQFSFFLSEEERAFKQARALVPKLHQKVNEFIFTRVVESRLVHAALGDLNGLIIWGEDEVVHWSEDVSLWVHDAVHLADHAPAATKQLHEEKLHLGERPIAASSHEAAQAGRAASLAERGEKLFAATERVAGEALSEDGVVRDQHGRTKGGWKVDRRWNILPTVSAARGVLQELAYRDHLHLSKNGVDHDLGLEVKLTDPFVKGTAIDATARWLTSKGPWHAGGSVHVVVAGLRESGTHLRNVDLTGFAGYDDGSTKTGVFVTVEQEYKRDPATGSVTAGEPVTTFHPYFSQQVGDSGSLGASFEFKRTPTVTLEETLKLSYTHRFTQDTYAQFSLLDSHKRDFMGADQGRTTQAQIALMREFGSSKSGQRAHVRAWAAYGARPNAQFGGRREKETSVGLELVIPF